MSAQQYSAIQHDAVEFLNGWISGYMAAGGKLLDDGLAEKATAAYERRLQPPSLSEPVRIYLDDLIAGVAFAGRERRHVPGCVLRRAHPGPCSTVGPQSRRDASQ